MKITKPDFGSFFRFLAVSLLILNGYGYIHNSQQLSDNNRASAGRAAVNRAFINQTEALQCEALVGFGEVNQVCMSPAVLAYYNPRNVSPIGTKTDHLRTRQLMCLVIFLLHDPYGNTPACTAEPEAAALVPAGK